MSAFKRIICIVLDGVGCGEAPDADAYGDRGSDSLGNTAAAIGGLRLPVLERLGLGNVVAMTGVSSTPEAEACWGRMCPASAGKDSITGHWELMGCVLQSPFPTYPDGFSRELVAEVERATGRSIIGNVVASGTDIIVELGDEHVASASPILYTSQDSVFQVAAHEDVVPVDALYRFCELATTVLFSRRAVARVIARPFSGESGAYYRTTRRKDFALQPPSTTALDLLSDAGRRVLTIGKISDLFDGRGISESRSTRNNDEGMMLTLAASAEPWDFIFTNLVDFDTMWGHRNDARAYALGLEDFDSYLAQLLNAIDDSTLVIVTSDHGNDPTTPSTDHSREYVPLIVWHKRLTGGRALATRATFADVGRTIADIFGLSGNLPGESFLSEVG